MMRISSESKILKTWILGFEYLILVILLPNLIHYYNNYKYGKYFGIPGEPEGFYYMPYPIYECSSISITLRE